MSDRSPLRVFFAGTPAIAVPALEAVARADGSGGFVLAGLLTAPDAAKGRSGRAEPSDCARALAGIAPEVPVFKPEKLDSGARERVGELRPDLLVSFAYGKIFGPKFLALFPRGGINVHPSLLPRHRGPSPIPAAILAGDSETGISVQRLAERMDCGDVLARERLALNGRETTASLGAEVAGRAAGLLVSVLAELAGGELVGEEQAEGLASYCRLLSKEDGRMDWGLSAAELDARVRAFDPWPLCWTHHAGRKLFILEAEALQAEALRAGAVDQGGGVAGVEPPLRGGAEDGLCPRQSSAEARGETSPSMTDLVPGTVLGKDGRLGILV
ncbi:MAG: methionyl-tRNA formyltransferase, partial [Treponema sp.]|nr:methionyl-tRNA formyltransferase [Treponema sp.]